MANTVLGRGTADAPRQVLWTGGWDSTFIAFEAVIVQSHVVQPIYVDSPDRSSTPHEFRAMEAIRRRFEADFPPDVVARLLPTRIIRREDVPPSPSGVAAFEALVAEHHMGIQYRWLTELCDWLETPLEVGMHWRTELAHGHGEFLIARSHEVDGVYVMREDVDWEPYIRVVGRYVFPILRYLKPQMRTVSQHYGFEELMRLTHSCHRPNARGVPCGLCSPCRGNIEENDGFGIPRINRWKFALREKLRAIRRRVA